MEDSDRAAGAFCLLDGAVKETVFEARCCASRLKVLSTGTQTASWRRLPDPVRLQLLLCSNRSGVNLPSRLLISAMTISQESISSFKAVKSFCVI